MGAKKAAGWAALLGAAALAAFWPAEPPATIPVSEAVLRAERQAAQSADPRFDALPARESLGAAPRPLFAAPPPEPPRPAAAVAAAKRAAPPVPPMPYRVAGHLVHEGRSHIVLARGEAVHIVAQGDRLQDGYRVERVGPEGVTLLYEPLGSRNILAYEAAAPAQTAAVEAQPARLRWEGPERVQAGSTFDVALRLSSDEPLRATPLQLSFDAAVLEPVQVRAGRYFSDGTFSYRVNPAGSIFIGASGKGADASDAELLVVRFRPIRPGAVAELKLSSVLLQGPAGRAITHAQPIAFRTAIVPPSAVHH